MSGGSVLLQPELIALKEKKKKCKSRFYSPSAPGKKCLGFLGGLLLKGHLSSSTIEMKRSRIDTPQGEQRKKK